MKKALISLATLSLACLFAPACVMDTAPEPGDLELDGTLNQAFADESFQATIALLQSKGIEVNLSAATLHPDGEDNTRTVSFPLIGDNHEELAFEIGSDGTARVIVKETTLPEEGSEPQAGRGPCITYLYANTCNYGPWASGAGCQNGPLYRYENRTRRIYSNGRQVSKNYDWYSCTWMAQPNDCQSNCG